MQSKISNPINNCNYARKKKVANITHVSYINKLVKPNKKSLTSRLVHVMLSLVDKS